MIQNYRAISGNSNRSLKIHRTSFAQVFGTAKQNRSWVSEQAITSGGNPNYKDYVPDAGAVCLAVLRRDGFISLDAGEQQGTLLTKSFKVNGKELFLNLNAGEGGLSVEVLSVDGTSLAASTDIHGNHTAVQTQWQEGKMAELLEQ